MMPTEPLRPPPEHAHLRWHWVEVELGEREVWQYFRVPGGMWITANSDEPVAPHWLKTDVKYIGPCDPAAITLNADGAPRWVKTNLNHNIRVKITAAGEKAWRLHWHCGGREAPDINRDADGWTTMQLWDCMAAFGSSLGCGMSLFIETEVEVEVES